MERRAVSIWQLLHEAFKTRRAAVAAALVVAVLLVGYFRAPAWPVLVGCAAALVILLASAHRAQPGP